MKMVILLRRDPEVVCFAKSIYGGGHFIYGGPLKISPLKWPILETSPLGGAPLQIYFRWWAFIRPDSTNQPIIILEYIMKNGNPSTHTSYLSVSLIHKWRTGPHPLSSLHHHLFVLAAGVPQRRSHSLHGPVVAP